MAETMKDFPTAVAMSVITGVLVHERFSEVHECMTYMAGEAVWTHQLPRISREAQAWAAVARPDLAPAIDEAETITQANYRDVLAVWIERYGPTIALPVLNADQHENIDPLSELVERVLPSKIIAVTPSSSEGENDHG